MKIDCKQPFPVSLDDGLTVTTIGPGVVDVPEWVAKVGIEFYGAKKVVVRKPKAKK